MNVNSLAHTKWNCKYYILFLPQIQEVISIQQSSMHGRKTEYGEIIFKNILLPIVDMNCQ